MNQLAAAGLADSVTFMSLNVFGRTLGPGNADGRQHNENHQVSIAIGKPFRGGVIGGVIPVGKDFGARTWIRRPASLCRWRHHGERYARLVRPHHAHGGGGRPRGRRCTSHLGQGDCVVARLKLDRLFR